MQPEAFPIVLKCRCGREVMVTGDAGDLVRLVEEKNALIREVEELRQQIAKRSN